METYLHVFCARCTKRHRNPIHANTLSGAIKKATLECDGIIMTHQGPKFTRCATGFSDNMVEA